MKKRIMAMVSGMILLLGTAGSQVIQAACCNKTEQMFYTPEIIQAEETENVQSSATGAAVTIEAPSAVLMEASTGTVIFEKESEKQLRPASITKIMTLILIFDALNDKKIKLEDVVTTSEHAASMGGSQVFLEVGEQQTVETMIKCISVASANDACAA